MCIIAIKPKGIEPPTDDVLHECFVNNADGAGFMWADEGKVHIHKGFKKFKSLKKALKHRAFTADDTVVYHCRISTGGGVTPGNTHPFPLSKDIKDLKSLTLTTDVGFAHNGIIKLTPSQADLSDTQEFIKTILYMEEVKKGLKEGNETTFKILDSLGGFSKFCVLTPKEVHKIGLGWVEEGGLLFSNKSYKKKVIYSSYAQWCYICKAYKDTERCTCGTACKKCQFISCQCKCDKCKYLLKFCECDETCVDCKRLNKYCECKLEFEIVKEEEEKGLAIYEAEEKVENGVITYVCPECGQDIDECDCYELCEACNSYRCICGAICIGCRKEIDRCSCEDKNLTEDEKELKDVLKDFLNTYWDIFKGEDTEWNSDIALSLAFETVKRELSIKNASNSCKVCGTELFPYCTTCKLVRSQNIN